MAIAFHLLTVALIILKLIGIITVSWWIVVLPSMFIIAVTLLIMLIAAAFVAVVA